MSIKHKHPWEYKQPIQKHKTTKEEFEKMLEIIKKKELEHKSDVFLSKEQHQRLSSPSKKVNQDYKIIDGIPHKFSNGSWNPLTKL